jgi:hypothetical protein
MGVYNLETILAKRAANKRGRWEKHLAFIKKKIITRKNNVFEQPNNLSAAPS